MVEKYEKQKANLNHNITTTSRIELLAKRVKKIKQQSLKQSQEEKNKHLTTT